MKDKKVLIPFRIERKFFDASHLINVDCIRLEIGKMKINFMSELKSRKM